MDDPNDAADPAVLIASLRALFDSLTRLPTDDPLKRQTRACLARILDLLENKDRAPHEQAST